MSRCASSVVHARLATGCGTECLTARGNGVRRLITGRFLPSQVSIKRPLRCNFLAYYLGFLSYLTTRGTHRATSLCGCL